MKINEIKQYKVSKSPYGESYYIYEKGQISWGRKPEGSIRISDHWNFYSRDRIHCPLVKKDFEEYDTRSWLVAVWRNGRYHVLKRATAKLDEWLAEVKRIYEAREALNELNTDLLIGWEVDEAKLAEVMKELEITKDDLKNYKFYTDYDNINWYLDRGIRVYRQDGELPVLGEKCESHVHFEIEGNELVARQGFIEIRRSL